MTLTERLDLLAELGASLRGPEEEELTAAIQQAFLENRWFTPENTRAALSALASTMLDREKLAAWAAGYAISTADHPEKTVGLVMAGNIPLVGFHDWLCVFVAGYRALVKLSDKDKRLLPYMIKKLGEMNFESWEYTEFIGEGEYLQGFDAMIATGSNNTARYFEQYFSRYPHIIRRNRHGVAVLDGSESAADLQALGRDIFTYFGLGCRNVSKLYLPRDYAFEPLLEALHEFRELANHDKYKNNFDYNFTLYILNHTPHLNNGCLLLIEDPSLSSRIASVHYEFYDDPARLDAQLMAQRDDIQCVVGKMRLASVPVLPLGHSQQPGLGDYADGVDVMAFLTGL